MTESLSCPMCRAPLRRKSGAPDERLRCDECHNSCTAEEAKLAASGREDESAKDLTAAVLSLLLPGLGQIYRGNFKAGAIWLIMAAVGYVMLVIPGLVVHACSVVMAYKGVAAAPRHGIEQPKS